jgi:hypothetical protein
VSGEPVASEFGAFLSAVARGAQPPKPLLIKITSRLLGSKTLDRTGSFVQVETTLPQSLKQWNLHEAMSSVWNQEEGWKQLRDDEVFVLTSKQLPDGSQCPITLGRSRHCDIRLTHHTVSGMHASIGYDADYGYYVLDEHSRNGTIVDGVLIAPGINTPLNDESILEFGELWCLFIAPNRVLERAQHMP